MVVAGQQHAMTDALERLRGGTPGAVDRLVPLVYGDLACIAHHLLGQEATGHSFASTSDLVHDHASRHRTARVIECRVFDGMTEPEIAAALDVASARSHAKTRGWLGRELSDGDT